MGIEYFQVIISLAAVIFLMFMCVYFLKKFKLAKYANNKQINIINMLSVGTKEKILLMEVNHKLLLVGVTANHIGTLHIFNEASEETAESSFANEMEKALTQAQVEM